MKQYPETTKKFIEFEAYIFDKLDGRNTRWYWSRKKGWCKFGSRTQLFDHTDRIYGPSINLFMNSLAEPLEKIARDNRWQEMTCFAEFWGSNTLAGLLNPDGTYSGTNLTLFDVCADKKGFIVPNDFVKLFSNSVETPRFIGRMNWTKDLVSRVREGKLEGVTFEGIVGKSNGKHNDRIVVKAKTQAWIDAVMGRCGKDGTKIVES
jgi:hypothetical protein